MYSIYADFVSLRQLHVGDLFAAMGVYVIWDGQARTRPTYIGEGNILKRFADHSLRSARASVRSFAHPIEGYVAILGERRTRTAKLEAQALERLLLDVARDTDRQPAVNVQPGSGAVVRLLCEAEPTLRVAVRGFDPLQHPRTARPLDTVKEIKVWRLGEDDYEFAHDWRLRRVQKKA